MANPQAPISAGEYQQQPQPQHQPQQQQHQQPQPQLEPQPQQEQQPQRQQEQKPQPQQKPAPLVDRSLSTAANLAKLLPTGTVLAFQSLNASFTNRGMCYAANRYLTLALITACSLSCAFFCFTDSFLGPGDKVYVGVATFGGFHILSPHVHQPKGVERQFWRATMRELRVRFVDFVHAFFSVMVFLALALSDSTVQSCLFQNPGRETKEYLVNLPLGAGFLASVVFMILPSTRRGIGYSDMTPRTLDPTTGGGNPTAVDNKHGSLVKDHHPMTQV